jgi:Zn-dependent M28 family amino/carboxypeptidase
MEGFNDAAMRAHVKFLANDLLEGRGPGTRGDDLATAYIASQFEAAGLEPAGDDGSFFQTVPLIGVTLQPDKSSISFVKEGGQSIGPLRFRDEWVGSDQTQQTSAALDSEVIFVGHGVIAPEEQWDDYKGIDTRGKTLVMLVDDPPATAEEPNRFGGRARTYYGRWTYKYEIGAAKGAGAVILIHTTAAAGYGWQVVRNSWAQEQSMMKRRDGEPALQLAAWITEDVARSLFRAAGLDLDAATVAAGRRDFRPMSLGYRLRGNIESSIRSFRTRNVIARLPGSDPKLSGQAVLYSAHHDHLGIGTPDKSGDAIYNGAIDNASGTALLLELARVWSTVQPPPRRSILFAAVAAEEQGLLGSAWHGQKPAFPASRIALGLNFDAIYMFGPVRDVTMIGLETTTFHPVAKRVTEAMGIEIVPDQAPEQGSYYRSDHFSFARVGIPAFSVKQGFGVSGKPNGWGRDWSTEYRRDRYHQPSDEYDASWDFASGVQIGQLGLWLGWEAANAATVPAWLPGAEFKAVREQSLSETK